MRSFRSCRAGEALPQQADGVPDSHPRRIGGSTHFVLFQKCFALRGIRQMFKEDGLIQPKTKKFHRRWKGEPAPAAPEKKPAAPKFAKVKNIPTKGSKKPKAKAASKKK